MAEAGNLRKRLKEIKAELAAAKEKVAALKTERDQVRAQLQAQKAAKAEKK